MIQYKVVYAQKAYQDLASIYYYILINSLEPSIAGNLVKEIKQAIASLDILPFRHELIENSRADLKDMRKLLVKSYVVLYRVNEAAKVVHVVRIFSSKRNYKNALNIS